jgi:HlyD family secretion protein
LDVEAAQSEVELADAELADAESRMAELVTPSTLDVEAARSEVALAETELEEAEADLAALRQPDELAVEAMQKKVALAEADLEEAESELAKLIEPDPGQVELREKQVEVARAVLDDATEDLEVVRLGADRLDVALSRAEAASSLAALEAAREALAAATLRAPWDGVVSAVNLEAGDSVNPNTGVLEVVDPSVVEINGVVDEIDILYVREGASASVTMDALAGQTLQGSVADVGTVAQSQSGVVTYPISIQMRVPAALDLPEGLSAVATVVLREDRDVLLVPVDALYGSFDQPVVRVSHNGSLEDREVVLGNSDGFWVVVESGVAEAELVLMESREASSQGIFGALRGLAGPPPGARGGEGRR